jgi:hypothetical protein
MLLSSGHDLSLSLSLFFSLSFFCLTFGVGGSDKKEKKKFNIDERGL